MAPAMHPHHSCRSLTGLFRQAIRFLLPERCAACDVTLNVDSVPFFCDPCWSRITPLHGPQCARCHAPFVSAMATAFSPGHLCHRCRRRLPAYDEAWTLYPYIPPLQEAIRLFKYRGKVSLRGPLARLMLQALPPNLDADVVLPVPLHPARLREREFNQSLLLADALGRRLRRPVSCTNLIRRTHTEAQTSLSRKARLNNLRHAFQVRRPELIRGRRVLLVDDVLTTGTTVNECAKTLRKAGSGPVLVLTLARTIDAAMIPDRFLFERPSPPLAVLGV